MQLASNQKYKQAVKCKEYAVELHNILFEHRQSDVCMRTSHIAGLAI